MSPRLPLALIALAGCAVAPAERAPDPAAPDPSRAEWRIHIDTKDRGMGAYTVALQWNAEVADIAEIVPCSPRYFKGTPEYDPASFPTGRTRIASLDVFGSRPRSGQWHLFTVVFRRKGPGTLSAKALLEKLYDDENKPFEGRLVDAEFRHVFAEK
jgi:hypothetical protein